MDTADKVEKTLQAGHSVDRKTNNANLSNIKLESRQTYGLKESSDGKKKTRLSSRGIQNTVLHK